MVALQKKVRSWCEECEAWHPVGQHIEKKVEGAPEPRAPEPRAPEPRAPELRAPELRAEPRPFATPPAGAPAPRGSSWLRFAIFLFVILPVGVVAWSGAAYAVMMIWPHIKAALG
jgi:hypothetical protein